MQFLRFQEKNEWEGEVWTFYLQLDGNEEALRQLAEKIGKIRTYRLYDDQFTEEEVDEMVKKGRVGYLPQYNKVVGKFDISKVIIDEDHDTLYKGGIRRCFQKQEQLCRKLRSL